MKQKVRKSPLINVFYLLLLASQIDVCLVNVFFVCMYLRHFLVVIYSFLGVVVVACKLHHHVHAYGDELYLSSTSLLVMHYTAKQGRLQKSIIDWGLMAAVWMKEGGGS